MSDDPRNIGGIWYGRYDALGFPETNSFVAHLDDDNGAISGTITEPDTKAMACGEPSSVAIEAERNSGS